MKTLPGLGFQPNNLTKEAMESQLIAVGLASYESIARYGRSFYLFQSLIGSVVDCGAVSATTSIKLS
ncbi:MAG: hypothetical protein MUE44_14115 [Oscillatoriaceae cyanobacterium Prado104]|nr:hypothetical protein [Oscillatoriaceae cyanobacterium Prado104]